MMAGVVLTAVTGCLWWLLARMGLCLASVADAEIGRLLVRRLRWMVVLGGLAAGCVLLAATTATESVAQPSQALDPTRSGIELGAYVAGGALGLAALAVWRYAQAIVRRALRDRASMPEVCKATARRIIATTEGGWPLLLRAQDGRWFWVTGSPESLAPVRSRLARNVGRGFRVTVTLQYHRRCRVVKEIRGMAVESVEAAWSPAVEPGSEPARA